MIVYSAPLGALPRLPALDRPRLYLLDDGDGRPVHASLPPCDPERTPRRVVRGVFVAMGAEDGGEWKP